MDVLAYSCPLCYVGTGVSNSRAYQRIVEAELFVGRAKQDHPTQVTSNSLLGPEERHRDLDAQVTEVSLALEESHYADSARVPSVSLGTEETRHCIDPVQASTIPLTDHIGPAGGSAASTGTEDTHHIDPTQVVIVSPSIEENFRLDPAQVKKHFDRIGRFRILVIGRSNAGKTTLLQRVCNTTEVPEIFNAQGERVKYSVTCNPSNYLCVAIHRLTSRLYRVHWRCVKCLVGGINYINFVQRGNHSIEDELIFQSDLRFIFHDSRGFETGSVNELNLMKAFVADRAVTMKLENRIHAIWWDDSVHH